MSYRKHFNPLHATFLFLYPLHTVQARCFQTFLGGIERDQLHRNVCRVIDVFYIAAE